jgi:hypothetical protein
MSRFSRIARGLATLPTAFRRRTHFRWRSTCAATAIVLTTAPRSGRNSRWMPAASPALHSGLVAVLGSMACPRTFNGAPNEVADAVPFSEDKAKRTYDPESAARFREALAVMLPVFERFRAGFTGKSSPLHFWWGSFDLAVTRFSGRSAPRHPGGVPGLPDRITREAYDQQLSSAGFWAGGAVQADAFFYSYAIPSPPAFANGLSPAGDERRLAGIHPAL